MVSPSHPTSDLLPLLPLPLPSFLSFLSTPLATSLTNSATNDFFAFAPLTADGKGSVVLRRGSEGCWGRLPGDWREYFEGVGEREQLLKDLANGRWERSDFPPSLQDYLKSCTTLSLPRACSSSPILSYPHTPSPSPPTFPSPPPPPQPSAKPNKGKGTNAARAGQSPKKAHEVEKMSELIKEILEEQKGRATHAIDVGSGRAHLSRALTLPPLSLHVIAVDWSATQTSGAEYLDFLKSRSPSPSPSTEQGSLTHQTSSLDAPAISQLLTHWPSHQQEDDPHPQPPSLLLALHACGDLTLSALEAFLTSPSKDRAAVLVGCCYNLQTPSLFPLSQTFSHALLPNLNASADAEPSPRLELTRAHLLLTAQAPPTWYDTITPSSFPHPSPLPPGTALRSSIRKLAFRARLEVELQAAGAVEGKGLGEKRVGRVGECSGWEEYRARALARYGAGEVAELELEGGEAGWEEALWKLQVFWTVRSWLGPPLESLLVLDRWCKLVEGLAEQGEWSEAVGEREEEAGEREHGKEQEAGRKKGRRVELINLFDQRTGSLRNLALVVR